MGGILKRSLMVGMVLVFACCLFAGCFGSPRQVETESSASVKDEPAPDEQSAEWGDETKANILKGAE